MVTDPWSLSTTAASNTTIGGVSAAEGILPANLNNIDRALGAGLRELVDVIGGAKTAGGTADALTITTGLSWSAYAAGQVVWFEAASTNTGAATMAIDGLAAKAITDNGGNALVAGDITAGGFYGVFYEAAADNFHLVNPGVGNDGTGTLVDVVDDTTPQLGGNLDVNGSDITSPDGTDLIDIVNGTITIQTASSTRLDITDSGVQLGGSGARVTTVLDEDDMASNSATALATQQSIKAYVDAAIIGQQTIWVPAGAMEPRVTTAPATSNVVEIGTSLIALRTMDFATDADDHAGFAIQMPKGWDESTLVAQFVWSTDGTQTAGLDGVRWFIRAGAYASNDVLTTALGTAVGATAQDHSGTANDVMITSETAAITVAGSPGAEEWVYFEVYRDVSDAGDDLDIDARLHGVKIHYTTDAATDD